MIWTKILYLINLLNKQFSNQLDLIYSKMLQDILLDVKSTFEKELVVTNKVTYTSLNRKRRMDMLMRRIKQRNNKVFNQIIDEIEQMNKIIYSDSYLRTAHDLEMQARINLGFSLPSENKIKHILKNPVDRLKLPKVLQRNSVQVIKEIKSIITQGVLLGEGYTKVANRISARLGISKRKALATARTETARASSIAQEEARKHAEEVTNIKIDKYWISALDNRVRATHQHLDGQKADEQGFFKSNGHKAQMPRLFGVASEDINCRCGVVHKLPKTRKTSKEIIPYMTYKEWRVNYIDENKYDSMAKTRMFETVNASNKHIRISAKKVPGINKDIWTDSKVKKSRDTLNMLLDIAGDFDNLPTTVIVKQEKLKGIAAYNHQQDVLYISNALNSSKTVDKLLQSNYFASKDFKDIITHELAHKKHWNSSKRLYKYNKKRYNNLIEAKQDLDRNLIAYVKNQVSFDRFYLTKISENAYDAFEMGNINELVAEVIVLNTTVHDKALLKLVKELLIYGNDTSK